MVFTLTPARSQKKLPVESFFGAEKKKHPFYCQPLQSNLLASKTVNVAEQNPTRISNRNAAPRQTNCLGLPSL